MVLKDCCCLDGFPATNHPRTMSYYEFEQKVQSQFTLNFLKFCDRARSKTLNAPAGNEKTVEARSQDDAANSRNVQSIHHDSPYFWCASQLVSGCKMMTGVRIIWIINQIMCQIHTLITHGLLITFYMNPRSGRYSGSYITNIHLSMVCKVS